MLHWFRRRAEVQRTAEKLYGSVVAAARNPGFYRGMGVPDTPEGRFELVALHLFLMLEGLKGQNAADPEVAQRTIETFVTDMDDCMREMGVGDMVVGKKVKRAAAAFYERSSVYRAALAAQGSELEDGIMQYVFEGDGSARDRAARLAHYTRAAADLSSKTPFDNLVADGSFARLLKANGAEEVS